MLPKKINILGTIYKIKYFEKEEEVDILGKENLIGQISYTKGEIRILSSGPVFQVLMHEIVHGILYHQGIKLSEEKTQALSTGLYFLIKEIEKWKIRS